MLIYVNAMLMTDAITSLHKIIYVDVLIVTVTLL